MRTHSLIVAAMEPWTLIAVLLLVAMAAATFVWRRRAMNAEASLHSIGAVIATSKNGSDLVGEVRTAVEIATRMNATAAAYLGVLEGASIGVAMANEMGEIQYCNSACRTDLFGDRKSELLRTRVSALARRVSESQRVEQIESNVHDPVPKVLTTTAVPLPPDAGSAGAVAIYIEDLSAQKRVDVMRTDFVANASHELKTPLGALSILAESLAGTHDEDARARLAGRLRDEATRMAVVIDDVVRLAETESLGVEFEVVEVVELVDDAVESVQHLASTKQINVVRGEIVRGDVSGSREQLTSAIRNLLENAITYTAVKDGPGIVTYRVRRERHSMCIDVEDTGIGVADRYVDRVFERFFRVDRARSRESGGTGLGLSIVKNVAQAHGGSVALHSAVGVGSTFTICIPEAEGVDE